MQGARMKPGETIVHQGKFWSVRKTQLRGPVSAPERWALLVMTDGNNTNPRIVAREWVRYRDIEEGKDG
jgi:hypothetical protein